VSAEAVVDKLDELLAEIRGLRADLREAARAGSRRIHADDAAALRGLRAVIPPRIAASSFNVRDLLTLPVHATAARLTWRCRSKLRSAA